MKKFSQIISAVFSPLLVPTYAVALSLFLTVLALVPAPVKWTVAGVCFAITCLVPLLAIILLHKLGVVKDPGLNDRNERLIPYAVSALSYCACAIYLRSAQAPGWLWLFMAGATLHRDLCGSQPMVEDQRTSDSHGWPYGNSFPHPRPATRRPRY